MVMMEASETLESSSGSEFSDCGQSFERVRYEHDPNPGSGKDDDTLDIDQNSWNEKKRAKCLCYCQGRVWL